MTHNVFSRQWVITHFIRELKQRARLPLRAINSLPFVRGRFEGDHTCEQVFVPEQRGHLQQGQPWDGEAIWQFHLSLSLSEQECRQPLWLEVDMQGEGTVYVDDRPVGSLDAAHDAALIYLPGEPTGADHSLAVRLMQTKHVHNEVRGPRLTGKPNPPLVFRSMTLVQYSRDISDYLYLCKALLQVIEHESDAALVEPLFDVLKQSILDIDLDEARGMIEQQCRDAHDNLLQVIRALNLEPRYGTFLFNGHSHLDIAFKWRIKQTVRKIERTNANTLRLLPLYPQARFTQSQAWILEQARARYPAQFEALQSMRAQQQVEFLGGVYVEPDTNLPCGEFLARQLILGQRLMVEMTGAITDTCYLPDTFGYAGSLPQLLAKAGFRYFVTSKLAWNDSNDFPHHLFDWIGLDGSAITAYLLPVTYGGPIEYKRVKRIADSGRNTQLTLVQYGEGDGGGGISREMLETLAAFKKLNLLGEIGDSQVSEAMGSLTAAKPERPRVHGELYFEKHRGVYTSQAAIKDRNRKLEQAYLNTELLASLSHLLGGQAYPKALLEQALKPLLVNQFHDILAGSLVKSAVEDALQDYQRVEQQLRELDRASVSALFSPGTDYAVLNLLSFARSESIQVGLPSGYALYHGEQRLVQTVCASGDAVSGTVPVQAWIEQVPAMGYRLLHVRPDPDLTAAAPPPPTPWSEAPVTLENDRYRLVFDIRGELTSLLDKQQAREVLRGPGNTLEVFKEYSGYFDSWDIFSDFERKQLPVAGSRISPVSRQGPSQQVRIERQLRRSRVIQTITLHDSSPLIDFLVEMDVQDRNLLFKLGFDTTIDSELARFDASFGLVERSTRNETPLEQAQFEVPMHKWCDLSAADYGMSLINENKYGCDIKGSKLRLTLLKTGVFPDPTQDLGQHRFSFALYPHPGDLRDPRCQTIQRAKAYNNPLQLIPRVAAQQPIGRFIGLDARSSYIEAVKVADDGQGIIVRLAEQLGQRDRLRLELPATHSPWLWHETDLLEHKLESSLSQSVEDALAVTLDPFEVKTLYLSPSP